MAYHGNRQICPWPGHYESTAMEMIKEDSTDKPCGRFWHRICCSCCYHRQCLFAAYIYWPMLFATGLGLLIACAVFFSIDAKAGAYLPANCTTSTNAYPAGDMLECDCKKGKNGRYCRRSYPCLTIKADYEIGSQSYNNPVFYEYGYITDDGRGCFYSPGKCEGEEDPAELLKEISDKIPVNTTFNCFYDPEKPSNVVYQIQELGAGPWIMLGIGIPCLLFGFFLTCIPVLVCRTKHLCNKRPTPEVIEEYNRKQAALPNATGRSNQAFVVGAAPGAPQPGALQNPGLKQPEGPNNWEKTNYGMDSGNAPPPPTYAAATEKKYDWE